MKIHRFFVPGKSIDLGEVTLPEDVSHQITRVLKLTEGETISVFSGDGFEWRSTILSVSKKGVIVKPVEKVMCPKPQHRVSLAQAIVKKDNFEWVTEKATELGVSRIIPIVTERTEKKDINLKRLEDISKEATEQSGQGTLVLIEEPIRLRSFLEKEKQVIAFHQTGTVFNKTMIGDGVTIVIGPEGGFSETEISLFHEYGVSLVSLGSQTFRAETAAVAALSLSLL